LPLFPKTRELLDEEGFVLTRPRRTDGQMRELINMILRCRLEGEQRRYFFETMVKDLLFRLLVQLNEKEPEKGRPTEREIDAVYKAEKIISDDLKEHFHIPELARKVQINEFRLKLVFRKIFGAAVHEYRQKKRLERAKEMLEAGMAVKVVAAETGYRITHFITAFQDYYGYTPGSIKRNRQ
jgi:AraC family transcriptional activator of pyochelin receptor